MNRRTLLVGILVLFSSLQGVAIHAAEQPQFNQEHGRPSDLEGHRPPPEAYTACEGKSAGAPAEMTTPQGDTLTGTCGTDRAGQLVLRPDRSNEQGGKRPPCPPPEAYSACEGKNVGDSAQFTTPGGETRFGTCEEDRDGRVVLRPDR